MFVSSTHLKSLCRMNEGFEVPLVILIYGLFIAFEMLG